MAFISGPQTGFAARGFRTCFFCAAARIGMVRDGLSARGLRLFQRLTRRGKGGFGLRYLLCRRGFFGIGDSTRFSRITIRTQRRMGFARAAQPRFGCGQFRLSRLQLRRTGGGGFSRLIGSAFGFADCLNRLGQRGGGGIAPCR